MSKPYSQPGEKGTGTNQASELFELCKEVYKRTGWQQKGTRMIFNDADDGAGLYKHLEGYLYTLDYLLEKLPDTLPQGELFVGKWGHSYWRAGYFDYEPAWSDLRDFSDTPLKALLKLTIALSEAGELK